MPNKESSKNKLKINDLVLDTQPSTLYYGDIMKQKKSHPWAKMGQFRNREFHSCRVCGNETSAFDICNACCRDPEPDITPFLSEKTASNSKNMYKMSEPLPYDSLAKMGI